MPNATGGLFRIEGPGIAAGVSMPGANAAPGVFTASYAFLEAGRFRVVFTASGNGAEKSAERALVVTAPVVAPTPPAPSASVKWM
jgi:hypothetical protein